MALGRQEGNGDSKTHFFSNMEDASLSNWYQVNDHQGNKGPKESWGNACMCVCAYVLIGLCVFGAEFERWKYVGGR